jgi:hypothetical protein
MKSDKIDYFLASTEVAGSLMAQDSELTVLSKPVRVLDIGAMFAKDAQGDALRAQMDEFIEKLKADGTLDEIYDYWRQPSHESTPVDMSGLTGQNGTRCALPPAAPRCPYPSWQTARSPERTRISP